MIRKISRLRIAAITAGALALSGCISFGPDAPESLLTLTATSAAPAGTGANGAATSAIAIAEPDAPARLAVTRVPVQIDDSEVAYLKDATWVERPARLFRRLMAETIRARSNRVVLDGGDPPPGDVARLEGTLREFGYDARSSSVIVRFDALRRDGQGNLQTRRFESIIPGILPQSAPVGDALNRAANDVAGQVADWVS